MKEFTELAQIGNFTEASSKLFLAQPTLSKHIKTMEAELGVSLLRRNKRSMELTEAGRAFLPYAKQIMQIQNEYTSVLAACGKEMKGTLHIGCLPSFSVYGIDCLISEFVSLHDQVTIRVEEYEKQQLLEMLHQKECDFAFVRNGRTHYSDLTKIPITTDRMVAVLPENHRLAGRGSIGLEELKYDRFLSREKHTGGYKVIMKMCSSAGYEPYIVCTSNRNRNLIEMVKRGVGVTLMNQGPAICGKRQGYVIVNLKQEAVSEVGLYYNENREMSLAAREFLGFVKEHRERVCGNWNLIT